MKGRTISPGKVEGEAIVSTEPIGFYGGIDIKTGVVIEKGHPLEGEKVSGKILVFPCGKGFCHSQSLSAKHGMDENKIISRIMNFGNLNCFIYILSSLDHWPLAKK